MFNVFIKVPTRPFLGQLNSVHNFIFYYLYSILIWLYFRFWRRWVRNLLFCCCCTIALKTETTKTTETSVKFYQTIRRNNVEDSQLHFNIIFQYNPKTLFIKKVSYWNRLADNYAVPSIWLNIYSVWENEQLKACTCSLAKRNCKDADCTWLLHVFGSWQMLEVN